MTEFNYGDIIEYIDCTRDLHFESARNWAYSHNTTFEELIHMRKLPMRYFQIGNEQIQQSSSINHIETTTRIPTTEELKIDVKLFRDKCLERYVDWYQSKPLLWEELEISERENIATYRKYLLNYTDTENWWLQNPLEYDEWLETK